VDAARQGEQVVAGDPEQALGRPRPGGDDDGPGADLAAVGELGDVVRAGPAQGGDGGVGQDLGAVAAGVLQGGEGQAGVVGDGVLVGDGAAEAGLGEQGLALAGGGRVRGCGGGGCGTG
jgi:hypothetical protein